MGFQSREEFCLGRQLKVSATETAAVVQAEDGK